MSTESENQKRAVNAALQNQIAILRAMSKMTLNKTAANKDSLVKSVAKVVVAKDIVSKIQEPCRLQIHEIAELSGLRDEKETQRYLFILEGQKLVSPCPAGDFTSKTWHITKYGVKAVKSLQ